MEEQDELTAMIAKAFNEDAEPAPEPVAAEPETPETELSAQTGEDKPDRVRDEHGRFAKAEETVQNQEAQGQEPAKTILPPRSWTAAAKAAFATLDPIVQQEVLRREGEIDAGKAQWDTKAEQYNKLDAALSKVRDRYRLAGLTDEQYVGALVNADEMLRGPNALQAIQMLAQQYGINLQGLMQGGSPQQGYQQPWQDPQIQTLQQQVQSLQAARDADAKAREAEAHQATLREIEAFASDPAHLYFDNVRGTMAALIQSNPQLSLQDAYDRACNADPDIRQLLSAAAVSKTATPQTKPAGLSVTGAPNGTQRAKPNGALNGNTVEDDVRAAFQELTGAV